ncbi:MAG: glycosyltransferase [SAR324 cluster bacterium]|nr:glycosyltransferase [SAR324 cluster bacterium]
MLTLLAKFVRLFQIWKEAGYLAVLRRIYIRLEGPRWAPHWNKWSLYQKLAPHWQQWVYRYWQRYSSPARHDWQQECKNWKLVAQFEIFLLGEEFDLLLQSIRSVLSQTYPHWHLHVLVKPPSSTLPDSFLEIHDARIQYHLIQPDSSFTTVFNRILQESGGNWMAFQFGGDQLESHAFFEMAKIVQNNEVDLVYSDDDHLDQNGVRCRPHFKPDWSPWKLIAHNYIRNLCVFRCETVKALQGLDEKETSNLYDLLLRVSENLPFDRIRHVPHIFYHHSQEKTASPLASKWYGIGETTHSQRVEQALERRKIKAAVRFNSELKIVTVFPELESTPLVSIIIPFRDQSALLRKAIHSIFNKSTYPHFEIILVDNQSLASTKKEVSELVESHSQLRMLSYDQPFNYSAINNFAVSHAEGDLLVLMNNDVEVLTPEWLERMAAYALFPQHGAIGAKLFYPNYTVQHAGIVTGIFGAAGHVHRFAGKEDPGYGLCLETIREVSAVTAACLMVRKELYHEVEGMDARHLSVAFNDVDFCMKLGEKGFSNLFLPTVEMLHYESFTRGKDVKPEQQSRVGQEIQTMQERWGSRLFRDPFYNPNLTLEAEDYFLQFPPFSPTE